jgi:hypothetical protein
LVQSEAGFVPPAEQLAEKVMKTDPSRTEVRSGLQEINNVDAGLKASSTRNRFFQQPVKPARFLSNHSGRAATDL